MTFGRVVDRCRIVFLVDSFTLGEYLLLDSFFDGFSLLTRFSLSLLCCLWWWEVCLGRVVALRHTLVSIQCVDGWNHDLFHILVVIQFVDGWNHDLFHTLVVIQFGVSWNHDPINMKWIKLSLQHRK